MSQKLLLIIGSPRSGTTLLNAMIGCHPDIAMLNEDYGHAVFNIVSKPVVGNKLCIPNQIELDKTGSYWRRQIQKRNLLQYEPESDLSITDYLNRGAQIIASIRHPDPVIKSIMMRGDRSRKLATYRWVRSTEIIEALRQEHPENLLVVAFPFLVSQPESVMMKVAEFLGIDFNPVMLEGYAHTPIYSNKGIDSSKADELDMPVSEVLASENGSAVASYHSLLSLVRETLKSEADRPL